MDGDRRVADTTGRRQRRLATFGSAVAICLGLAVVASAPAQDLQGDVSEKRDQLDHAHQQEGVLSSEIQKYSSEIDQLSGEVATLRNREAAVIAELEQTQEQLRTERERLRELRDRLARSIKVLEERLVAIYKSDQPDVMTVILQADGFDDLLERYEYLNRIESQDSAIVARVRELRAETEETVDRVRAARDSIAAKRRELARTRAQLESRQASLTAVRSNKQGALSEIEGNIERLEGDISGLEDKIQAQLQSSAGPSLPAGPVRDAGGGFIWPVNGSVVSGFGMRWGRLHAGIDIAVGSGTPIRAAKSGTIALAAPTSGYGNYTCISHGGGLSTCYAHQSRFARTSGSVSQGQVIGYVGCTGTCYGDHLHFEVRVNGSPVDPMGYL